MQKYRKKPVVTEVQAQQFDPSKPSHEWPFGVRWVPEVMGQDGREGGFYQLDTSVGGVEFPKKGDWIIYDEDGDRSVISNKGFRATYEPVEVNQTK